MAFAGVAFTMVSLAENARIPVDNPSTHLELTMIHEAMVLEYSARHLALLEWAAALKLFNYSCIGIALFFPQGAFDPAPYGRVLWVKALGTRTRTPESRFHDLVVVSAEDAARIQVAAEPFPASYTNSFCGGFPSQNQ